MRLLSMGNPVGRAQALSHYNDNGPDDVTSTTTNTPPDFLLPGLRQAAGASQRNFQASQGDESRRLLGDAQDLTGQNLRGDFLSPDSNPFLQQTFDRAADLTQTRLSSEFAGSGRNLGAARPARSEELQTLSSNIFGGNFQRERDRQQSSITDAQGLDPINQLINRLAGIIPGAGGVTTSQQPVFRTGLF